MKDLRTLREEIILALGSFADNVKIILYEDKFYIVECPDCDGWSRFIKCGNLLAENKSLNAIGDGMYNCYYVEYKD